jgi:hypothetical protein
MTMIQRLGRMAELAGCPPPGKTAVTATPAPAERLVP